MEQYFGAPLESFLATILSAIGIFAVVIIFTRISGKRTFSKMSSFDFAATIAIGSIIASGVLTPGVTLSQAAVGLASIYLLQFLVSWLRRYKPVQNAVDNAPLLLMDGETILYENMKKGRVTEGDLRSKLREANVLNLSQVRAVVFEATGDIAVLHASNENQELEDWLIEDVLR